ncbi:MAG: hypothetical protein LQ339_005623 [Xanthoria mediterranea]|nr:MAG: hypothetical protein LQ339_005623 [Xanthoria mediterranea]
MAFQNPIPAPSHPTLPRSEEDRPAASNVVPQQIPPAEWLLFPNPRQHPSSWSQTASTNCSPQTAGLSKLSGFGSLNDDTIAHDALEDDELDSLDDGLHAFHEDMFDQHPAQIDQSSSILPTHDGLGTFPGSSHPVQEHLWHFERFNPQRRSSGHHRRSSSVHRRLTALEVDDGLQMEKQRMERIERWRIEHSRILLEEVEKATRRDSNHPMCLSNVAVPDPAIQAHTGSISESLVAPQEGPMPHLEKDPGAVQHNEDGWHRVLRRLIGDLMGISDTTLALVFGEALPESQSSPRYNTSILSSSNGADRSLALQSTPSWMVDLLERLSKELASFLRSLAQSPAAIGSPINSLSLDYAGIPIAEPRIQRSAVSSLPHAGQVAVDVGSMTTPIFNPTLDEFHKPAKSEFENAALWGIEEEPANALSATQEREYWEQTPSIRTIFRLLHQHFTVRRRPLLTSSALSSSKPSNVATTSTADSLRRAAVIRQQHPLVSRQGARRNAPGNILGHAHRHHGSYPNLSSPLFKRSESSCASISARKSRRGSGSSRNYWDLRGSAGSGSMGGMGFWGEV